MINGYIINFNSIVHKPNDIESKFMVLKINIIIFYHIIIKELIQINNIKNILKLILILEVQIK